MQIKTKDANLYNCEGFMTDMELVDKINNSFKNDTEFGMTLAGLIEVAPRDFFSPMGDGEIMFTKSEVDKVIKYLDAFGLSLNQMVRANKSKRYHGEVRQIQVTNLDVQPAVTYGYNPTDAELDKAVEENEAFQKKIDEDPIEQARIAATATPVAIQ
jgi:hypothetical protein